MKYQLSHPVWVRGLKQVAVVMQHQVITSHPVWVRGLKLLHVSNRASHYVAPRVGAWIETPAPCS